MASGDGLSGLGYELGAEEIRAQLTRIVDSPMFCHAPLLKQFLQFVAGKAIEGRIAEVSEYTIGTEVLGRPSDFDPTTNTIVRTQAYRLRQKLKEYYETVGKSDHIVIAIPTGHYIPSFSVRSLSSKVEEASATPPLAESLLLPFRETSPTRIPAIRRRVAMIAGAALLFAALIFLGGVSVGLHVVAVRERSTNWSTHSPLLHSFWNGFLSNGKTIVIGYTNAVFLESQTGDLLSFRGGAVGDRGASVSRDDSLAGTLSPSLVKIAGPLYYEDGYTGTGEVLSVQRLTNLLSPLGANVIVKRAPLVTISDLRNDNVIFLGSPFQNQFLADIRLGQRFIFQQPRGIPLLWNGRLVDTTAKTARNRYYEVERDPRTHVLLADYAIFDVLPGIAPGRRIVELAGLSTSGTAGATEFAFSEAGLRQILEKLASKTGSRKALPDHFESLLRVELVDGIDVLHVHVVRVIAN